MRFASKTPGTILLMSLACSSLLACGGLKDILAPETAPTVKSEVAMLNETSEAVDFPPLPEPLPDQVSGGRPAPALGTNPLPPDYRSNDEGNVDRDDLTKRMTGGVTWNGLVYTSSSTDELLNFLRWRNEKVDPVTRSYNMEAAASVREAIFSWDHFSDEIFVTLKVSEKGGDSVAYNLSGSLGQEKAVQLKWVRSANGEITTGVRPIEGSVKCVDFDGGCESIFVRLKIGEKGSSAIINVVFRNSIADVFFDFPVENSDNAAYMEIKDFVLNTVKKLETKDKIKSVRMSSWEVVNGRAEVKLFIRGFNNELLAFGAPLLAPETGTRVNLRLSRIAKEQQADLDLSPGVETKLNYANMISDGRLVANNGLGQVRIALKMRNISSDQQNHFTATFMRRIKPIVDLTNDQLK
jgi:hypothetical protein